ncbi:MAG: hypothetical protein KKH84_00615, partial [Proteobacteria bacterium]|nr:hypothetical protein [Pseudomonadota bacterium]MBU4419490.1 hypothetical protein [Pseudomonadota bacterium]
MKPQTTNYKPRKCGFFLILIFTLTIFSSLISPSAHAKVTGECVNCHTMHNSQGGTAMATYGGGSGPNSCLTRGTCLGCHGQGGASKIVTIGGSQIPQVSHTDSTDLAGGNFKYIDTADNRGHNVIALGNNDDVLTVPPSGELGHPTSVTNTNLRCAGKFGCHGTRIDASKTEIEQLKGAHHQNVDGKCDTATENYNSYRFLRGVKGLENTTDKWQ